MKKNISNLLKSVDILGSEFQLTHEKRDRYATILGGIVSIFIFWILGVAFLTFLYDLFDSSSPQVLETIEASLIYPKYSLFDNKQVLFIALSQNDVLLGKDDLLKYITPKIRVTEHTNVDNLLSSKDTLFEFVECTQADKTLYSEFISDQKIAAFMEKYGYCVRIDAPEKFFVEGKISTGNYTSAMMEIFPCSLENQASCVDPSTTTVHIGKITRGFNPSKYGNPLELLATFEEDIRIDASLAPFATQSITKIEVFDDRIDFFPNIARAESVELTKPIYYTKTRDSTQLYCTSDQIINNECHHYFYIETRSSGNSHNIIRIYIKFIDTLGNIGGVSQVLILLGVLMYMLCKDRMYNSYMRKSIMQKGIEEYRPFFNGKSDKEIYSLVDQMIDEKKDANRVLEQINYAEIMMDQILTQQHHALIPLMLMQIEEDRREQLAKQKNDFFLSIMQGIKSIGEKPSLDAALKQIKDRVEKNEGTDFEKRLDRYFLSILLPSDEEHTHEKTTKPTKLEMAGEMNDIVKEGSDSSDNQQVKLNKIIPGGISPVPSPDGILRKESMSSNFTINSKKIENHEASMFGVPTSKISKFAENGPKRQHTTPLK